MIIFLDLLSLYFWVRRFQSFCLLSVLVSWKNILEIAIRVLFFRIQPNWHAGWKAWKKVTIQIHHSCKAHITWNTMNELTNYQNILQKFNFKTCLLHHITCVHLIFCPEISQFRGIGIHNSFEYHNVHVARLISLQQHSNRKGFDPLIIHTAQVGLTLNYWLCIMQHVSNLLCLRHKIDLVSSKWPFLHCHQFQSNLNWFHFH